MRFVLTINLENDAFVGDWPGLEVSKLLRHTSNRVREATIEEMIAGDTLLDSNGNNVGNWIVES